VIPKENGVLTGKSGSQGRLKKRERNRGMTSGGKDFTKERIKRSGLRELIQQTVRRRGIKAKRGHVEETLERRGVTATHSESGKTVTRNLTTDKRKASKIGKRKRIPRGKLTGARSEKGTKKRARMNESEVFIYERETSEKENIASRSGKSGEPSAIISKTNGIGGDEDGNSIESESLRRGPSFDDGARDSRNQKLVGLRRSEDRNGTPIRRQNG